MRVGVRRWWRTMSSEEGPGAYTAAGCGISHRSPRQANGNEVEDLEFRGLLQTLHPAATKWKNIGLELHCPPEQLELIERTPRNTNDAHFLYDMLYYRQSKTEPSELTWEDICRALNSNIVGESKLARRIAKDHCPQLLQYNRRLHDKTLHRGLSVTGELWILSGG